MEYHYLLSQIGILSFDLSSGEAYIRLWEHNYLLAQLIILKLMEFAYNNSYQATIGMAPYEALYGRKCRSPVYWDKVGERKLLGPDMVCEMAEVVTQIRQRMQTAPNQQKSYADQRRRLLEFTVGDQVFLKIAPMKGVMRFGKKGKLSPRYIGLFTITERIGNVAYKLDLPSSMSQVHNVFHVSTLRKYIGNPSHVLRNEPMEIKPDLTYEKKPVEILQREIKQLRSKKIPLVKVL
ncbi:uncharacterized protein LOC111385548 [Olea europaea var. sylvestris]|uniref:uncharacterized protein LOC111385548 n=1 Tax=Olea europaea var. sylvestris TaxID=158386 RepID=UPI000C1D6041|nr:uncharacterized protein LOC111385548 [Olea europaea var. sylvestris]